MSIDYSVFSRTELQIITRLNTTAKVQDFVTGVRYNKSDRVSIVDVIRKETGDCLEAAAFASVVLTYHNIPNQIMDLHSVRDEDHVLCVFTQRGRLGAIGQSKYLGLRYRNPVYSTVRELAMSYFEGYYNYFGEYTLRGYSKFVSLRNLTKEQLTSAAFMCELEVRLCKIAHMRLVPDNIKLPRVSPVKFRQEVLIIPKEVRVGKRYQRK
jgi:hypothetical protein